MRALIRFSKTGPARFISHLDLLRGMQRALRRAGLPVAYSQGFNPHMILSFATALSLGYESVCEVMDLKLQKDMRAQDVLSALNAALPPGLAALEARMVADGAPSLTPRIRFASYEARVPCDMRAKIADFLALPSCTAEKRGKKGTREVDIRPLVCALSQEEDGLVHMTLAHSAEQALNPELLLSAMGVQGPCRILRTGLHTLEGGNMTNVLDGDCAL